MPYYSYTQPVGKKPNQDSYQIQETSSHILLLIADGVGGLPHAAYASKFAIHCFLQLFKQTQTTNLPSIRKKVNQQLIQEIQTKKQQMATTILASLIDKKTKEVYISYVGDSRAYIINNSNIWKTKDHTLVQDLVDLEILNDEQAQHHPERSRLKQALAIGTDIIIPQEQKNLKNSILFLSTDGLHDYVSDKEIATTLLQHPLNSVCTLLTKKARENNSKDDITSIVFQF
jgi:PPM family protein phosphatase